ncbi:hypothetical protein PMAYCL1PPCAC_09336, partial [Pristionchus mayeri]
HLVTLNVNFVKRPTFTNIRSKSTCDFIRWMKMEDALSNVGTVGKDSVCRLCCQGINLRNDRGGTVSEENPLRRLWKELFTISPL